MKAWLSARIDDFVTWWDSKTAIERDRVHNVLAFAWGFGTVSKPRLSNYQLDIERGRTLVQDGTKRIIGLPKDTTTEPLYWNGIYFVRFTYPFGIFWMIRWGGAQADPALFQSGFGYDFHGRFRLINRKQSDASAHAGVTIPNPWEAWGWAYGGH